jgi:hypothetical protein
LAFWHGRDDFVDGIGSIARNLWIICLSKIVPLLNFKSI